MNRFTPTEEGFEQAYRAPDRSGSADRQFIDFVSIVGIMWRGRWLIAACIVLTTAVGMFAIVETAPIYAAETKLMLDQRQRRITTGEEVVSSLQLNEAAVAGEATVISSNVLLGTVAEKLNLAEHPGFTAELLTPSVPKQLFDQAAGYVRTALGLPVPPVPEGDPLSPERITRALQGDLNVSRDGVSYVIEISYTSTDPELAALVPNTVAAEYINSQLEERRSATRSAVTWLESQIGLLERDVESAEAAVLARRAENIAQGQSGLTPANQQLDELSRQISVARADRLAIEAELDRLDTMIATEGRTATSDIIDSPLALQLKADRARLESEREELGARHGNGHPLVLDIDAKISAIDVSLATEVDHYRSRVENQRQVAVMRETGLERSAREFEGRIVTLSQAEIQLRQLEREADATREMYQSLLSRLNEARAQAEQGQASARVIARAEVPPGPFWPKRSLVLAIAVIIGGALGAAIVFMREIFAPRIRDEREADVLIGLPVLASIPRDRRLRGAPLLRRLNSDKAPVFSEELRQLRTNLLLSRFSHGVNSIAIASSVAGEGRTTICLSLAYLSSRLGSNVIVVDADIRNPTLSKGMREHLKDRGDLISVLSGRHKVEEAIVHLPDAGFDVLPCAKSLSPMSDALTVEAFSSLMADLGRRYDGVIIDVPPTLSVADTLVLCNVADTCLYIVDSRRTSRRSVQSGISALSDVGVQFAGLVLNMTRRSK